MWTVHKNQRTLYLRAVFKPPAVAHIQWNGMKWNEIKTTRTTTNQYIFRITESRIHFSISFFCRAHKYTYTSAQAYKYTHPFISLRLQFLLLHFLFDFVRVVLLFDLVWFGLRFGSKFIAWSFHFKFDQWSRKRRTQFLFTKFCISLLDPQSSALRLNGWHFFSFFYSCVFICKCAGVFVLFHLNSFHCTASLVELSFGLLFTLLHWR